MPRVRAALRLRGRSIQILACALLSPLPARGLLIELAAFFYEHIPLAAVEETPTWMGY